MYLLNDNNQQEKPKKEQPVQQEQPQEQPQEDVTENNNEFIKEEHCLEKICVETITIKKDLTTNKILVTGELTKVGDYKVIIFINDKTFETKISVKDKTITDDENIVLPEDDVINDENNNVDSRREVVSTVHLFLSHQVSDA